MPELSWLLTVYELAFFLFRVKEAAQVEDDGQEEHEAGHSDDGHRLLPGQGAVEVLAPQLAGHVHLKKTRQPFGQKNVNLENKTETWDTSLIVNDAPHLLSPCTESDSAPFGRTGHPGSCRSFYSGCTALSGCPAWKET